MTPRERVLAVLRKEPVDKVPFTIYETKIPRCAVERHLRNKGMGIVNRQISAYLTKTPNCINETHTYIENGKQRIRTNIRTPVGEVYTIQEPAGFTTWTLEKLFKKTKDYKILMYIRLSIKPFYLHDFHCFPIYLG